MKKIIVAVVVVIILVLVVLFFLGKSKKTTPSPSAQESQQMGPPPLPQSNEPIPLQVFDKEAVEIRNFTFSPSIAAITKGGTITWTNNDSVTHTVTSPETLTRVSSLPARPSAILLIKLEPLTIIVQYTPL